LILVYVIILGKNTYKMIKAIALLLVFVGAGGFVTGLLGVFGKDLISISPWILTILGFFFLPVRIRSIKKRP